MHARRYQLLTFRDRSMCDVRRGKDRQMAAMAIIMLVTGTRREG